MRQHILRSVLRRKLKEEIRLIALNLAESTDAPLEGVFSLPAPEKKGETLYLHLSPKGPSQCLCTELHISTRKDVS